jgi:hypothetical protein
MSYESWETRAEIGAVRTELRDEIRSVRLELRDEVSTLRRKTLNFQTWVVSGVIFMLVLAIDAAVVLAARL